MGKIAEFINEIENVNTKKALNLVYRKLNTFAETNQKTVENLTEEEIRKFLLQVYAGKSETTISNAIASIKRCFKAIGKSEVVANINYINLKKDIFYKKDIYFTPTEVYEIVENLLNYQDKALVLLVYACDLYDENFETIIHLKEHQIKEDHIEIKNRKIYFNEYVGAIFHMAKEEMVYEKYNNSLESSITLRPKNGYFMRGQVSLKSDNPFVSTIMLKKRFKTYSDYLEIEGLTPINLKNSKLVYDLAKMELEYNDGIDINQLTLKNYIKDTKKTCCIERVNMGKKSMKERIFEEIIKKEDVICR